MEIYVPQNFLANGTHTAHVVYMNYTDTCVDIINKQKQKVQLTS